MDGKRILPLGFSWNIWFHQAHDRHHLTKRSTFLEKTPPPPSEKRTLGLGLTASLVSQFFSGEFCGKWYSLLAKISVWVPQVSWVLRGGKNAMYCELVNLIICECRNLRDSQTSKIIIHSEKLVLDPKFSQDSRKTLEVKLVMILSSLPTKFLFARLASLATKFFCETRKQRVLLRNFFLRNS